MKIFNNWTEDKTGSFVIFLGREARDHSRRMRKLFNEYQKSGDIEALKQYTVQCGAAMQTKSLFVIAKYHFSLDNINRKYAPKKPL